MEAVSSIFRWFLTESKITRGLGLTLSLSHVFIFSIRLSKPLSTLLGTVASMKGETRRGQRGQLMPAGSRERFIPWKQQARCFLVCRESRASNHPSVYFTRDPISLRHPSVERILFRHIRFDLSRSRKVDLYYDKTDLKNIYIFHKLRKRIEMKFFHLENRLESVSIPE